MQIYIKTEIDDVLNSLNIENQASTSENGSLRVKKSIL
jgi:hypothetical protein